jgi:O-antigen ligase
MIKIAQFLLSLTIIFSPLYIWRSFVILPSLNFYLPYTFLEILILCSVSVTFLIAIRNKYKIGEFRTSLDPFIGLFLISGLLALFTSYDLIGGLGIFKAYIVEPILFYYALIFIVRQTSYRFILISLITSAIWLIGLALLQKFFGIFIFAPIEQEQHRITAVFNSANSLALYIGPIGLVAISKFFVTSYKKLAKYIYFLLFLLIMLVFYFTRSRGGMIAMVGALSVFTFAILTLKNHIIRKFWYIAPLVVLICLVTFFVYIYQNYDFFRVDYSRPYTEGDTLQIRYFIWGGTINMLKDHFVFGAGLNGFKTLYSNQYRPIQYQEQFQYPHNILLTIWTEMGILGLFSFLLILVELYSVLIRRLQNNHAPILGAALLGIMSYWMLHGMVDVPYFKNDLSVEFWVVAALIESWRLRG